jgi:hypothetical protein
VRRPVGAPRRCLRREVADDRERQHGHGGGGGLARRTPGLRELLPLFNNLPTRSFPAPLFLNISRITSDELVREASASPALTEPNDARRACKVSGQNSISVLNIRKLDMKRQRRTIDELRNSLRNASSEVARQAGPRARRFSAMAADRLPDAYRWTKAVAREGSDQAIDLAEDGYRIAGRHFNEANNMASNGLRDSVLPALLLAGAAGYIISYLIHHRRFSRTNLPRLERERYGASPSVAPPESRAAPENAE